MDRIIALLAALVALIALGGALLVHNNADAALARQAGEIADLRSALAAPPVAPAPAPAPAPVVDDVAVAALTARVAELEATLRRQAVAAVPPPAEAPATEVAALAPAPTPAASAPAPAAFDAAGPTTDCIPLGTRFMAQAGDSYPICRTRLTVNVSAVDEGSAIVEGTGPVAAGGFGNLAVQGCTVMVFSADLSGYAEMRVSCV